MRGSWGGPTLGLLWLSGALVCACGEAHDLPDSARGGDAVALDGARSAALTITPEVQSFGDVFVGEPVDASFVVNNGGDAASGPLALELSGDEAFTLVASECADPLAPGDSCAVRVRFAPETLGSASAELSVSDRSTRAVARLEATGLLPPRLSIMPTPFDFGTVTVGARSTTQSFTVGNARRTATGPVEVTLGGVDSSEFQILSEDCTSGIAAEGGCTVEVVYAPTSAGVHAASLDITGGDFVSAALSGTGMGVSPMLRLAPSSGDFGALCLGTSATLSFTLTNDGGGPAAFSSSIVGADAADFAILGSSTCRVLDPGESCTIDVAFTPAIVGFKTASLRVDHGTASVSAALTGSALACGSLVITPLAASFGTVPVGTASSGVVFTVTNTGTSPTGLVSFTVIGAGAASFVILADGCTGSVLPAGGACMVTVAFVPVSIGMHTASIRASASPGGAATAAMSGTAI